MHLVWIMLLACVLCAAFCAQPANCDDAASGPLVVDVNKDLNHSAAFWLESSLTRVFPTSSAGDRTRLRVLSARNARTSFQACVRNNGYWHIYTNCSVEAPEGIRATVRRVGYVPMRGFTWGTVKEDLDGIGHLPGLVPDPLHPDTQARIPPLTTQSFWVTIDVPADTPPGVHELNVRLNTQGVEGSVEMKVDLDLRPLVIKPRKDFPVTHWWNADAIYDHYKVEAFGDEWFKLAEAYLANMISHGSNVAFVPLFHHRREVVKRPAQLLIVNVKEPGVYEFDWSRVRRFVAMAKRLGFEYFEWPHFWHMKINMVPHYEIIGAAEPARVYTRENGQYRLIVPHDAGAMDEEWLSFLRQMLPELRSLIREEGLEDVSYYHVSDEPGEAQIDIDNYRAAREKLRELAPWTDGRVMDAMSDVRYGRLGLIDYPVPNVASAANYIAEGIPHWVYYCCGPVGPYTNRFFDTPLIKTRMIGALCYKLRALGFLHWGFNYWYVMDLGHNPTPQDFVDPFTGGAFEPYGDGHVVYPGAAGPLDCIRWEVFAEGLQDYAILQSAGVSPDDPMLKDIIDYGAFPRSEEWLTAVLDKVMAQ